MKRVPWLLLVLCALAGVARADIYTWVDAHGVRHFSDVAAAHTARRADLPGLQHANGDPDALTRLQARERATAARSHAAKSKAADSTHKPVITSPGNGATIRNADHTVAVTVSLGGSSELRKGEQITYYLDGSPLPKSPSTLTSIRIGNVPRGTHTLSAALLVDGREIGRSAPITFYMMPPSAISPLNAGQGGSHGQSPSGAPVATPAGNVEGAPAAPRPNTSSAPAGSPSM